jgi:death-on-curing family protein
LLEPAKVVAKLPRIAQFVDKVIDFAKRSPAAAERAVGWLRGIADQMDSVKNFLPQSVWDQLAPIRKKIDDFLAPRGALEFGGFAKGISADEIAAINSRLGGSLLQGSPTSALAAAARQEGFFNKSAAMIRSIVKNHTFTDANKRTAQQVFEALKARNGVTPGVSSAETRRIIQQIAEGKLDDISEIAKLLRGF